ncbi:uncharacterized protein LOC132533072 isoform X2 [Erinaceus europaeus]|nr:uncharacterized protein LOC132533072 isoform X2 [Erinaceus europaeus]
MGPGREGAGDQSVIWISDEEVDADLGDSVLLVEPAAEPGLEERPPEEPVDEDCELVVTFCKKGSVMPHARHDCPIHPFERTESEQACPVGQNAATCSQCFCYICDGPASECQLWTTPLLGHCNAHNRSQYWRTQRGRALGGILVTFNLEPSEISTHLRRGGERLLRFGQELAEAYSRYLCGEPVACTCWSEPHSRWCPVRQQPQAPVYRYSEVFEVVSSFVSQAELEHPEAAAIMLLGTVKELAQHKDPSLTWRSTRSPEALKLAVPVLMERIMQQLQRLLVLGDLAPTLTDKLTHFFRSVPLPPHCFSFTNSLNVVPWDHRLLTTILRGQKVAGHARKKGKRELLWEAFTVIRARVDRLESAAQYRELVRYLRAVMCEDSDSLQELLDRVPFYLCKCGDFAAAAEALLAPTGLGRCPASRLPPPHFRNYLKMLRTGSVPEGSDLRGAAQWAVSIGPPVKAWVLARQALRMLHGSPDLYADVQCWGTLMNLWGSSPVLTQNGHLTPLALQTPSSSFQRAVLNTADRVLHELRSQGARAQPALPSQLFCGPLDLEACLLLCVRATVHMLTEQPRLPPMLGLLLALGENVWALEVLLEGLTHKAADVADVLLQDLSDQRGSLLEAWRALGPGYVGQLLSLFLGSERQEMQAVGISLSHVVTENLSQCPWASALDLSQLRIFKRRQLGAANLLHLSRALSILENLGPVRGATVVLERQNQGPSPRAQSEGPRR